MAETAYEELRSLPEANRLLDILRSDNPLVALGVSTREVSWTRFLAWLLDPVVHSGSRLGPLFLEALFATARRGVEKLLDPSQGTVLPADSVRNDLQDAAALGKQVAEIYYAIPEVVEGKSGRIDLLVGCRVGSRTLTFIVENKIGAKERPNQLKDYVVSRQRKREAGELLLPILLSLGDEVEEASYPGAVVLGRREVADWLTLGVERCKDEGVQAPRLVEDYLNIFEAQDIAKELRASHRDLLEKVEIEDPSAKEWKLLQKYLSSGDGPFFGEVAAHAAMEAALKGHGLTEVEVYGKILGRNEGLKISKPYWTVHPAGPQDKAVNVHFESARRGQLVLHVELHPYEGSIEKRGLTEKFRQQLVFKASLIRELRSSLQDSSRGKNGRQASSKGLREPQYPSTLCVVKFDTGLGEDCLPASCARRFAEIIDKVASAIDEIVKRRDLEN